MNKKLEWRVKPKFYDEIKEYEAKVGGTFNQLIINIKLAITKLSSNAVDCYNINTYNFILDLFNKYNRTDETSTCAQDFSQYDNIKYKYMDLENIIINTLCVMHEIDYDPYKVYFNTLHNDKKCFIDKNCIRWRDIAIAPSEDKAWNFIEINEPVVFSKDHKIDINRTIEYAKTINNVKEIALSPSNVFDYFTNGNKDIGAYCIKCYSVF